MCEPSSCAPRAGPPTATRKYTAIQSFMRARVKGDRQMDRQRLCTGKLDGADHNVSPNHLRSEVQRRFRPALAADRRVVAHLPTCEYRRRLKLFIHR